jgi:tRNA pseudouridine38-40 synthase
VNASAKSGLRNIRMTLEYDGTRYVGWQRQLNGMSVQEKVESALSRHIGETVRVSAAGRTDSRVHALGQVINFHTGSTLPPVAIMRGTLSFLPEDIAITAADEVPPSFDARKNARLRWYRYCLLNRSVAPAAGRQFLTHVRYHLDFDRMRAAAAVLAGHHDFRAFRAVTCTAKRTLLTMAEPEITFGPDHLIIMDFRCRSFLQNMVRILAGTLVAAARGKLTNDDIREMLETGRRRNEAVTLSPRGLFLYRVIYEDPSR